MLYVVINGLMYQKPDGKSGAMQSIPLPLSEEAERDVKEVWRRYDESGQPFMMYHEPKCLT